MHAGRIVGTPVSRMVGGAVVLVFGASVALGQAGPPRDQDKLLNDPTLWGPSPQKPRGWSLQFTDSDGDTWHDKGEQYSAVAGGRPWRTDRSCWMASAANMLDHEGFGNPYLGWLKNGGARSSNFSTWQDEYYSASGENRMTFDDGGWQHWALEYAGRDLQGPIVTHPEFGGAWEQDPIAWCQRKLAANHAVGLTIHWGQGGGGREECPRLPGRLDRSSPCGYHAITLWEIDEAAQTITITDSDDGDGPGETAFPFHYNYAGDQWILTDYFPGVEVHVNYAVSFPEETPAVSDWGMLLIVLLLLTGITIKFAWRRPHNTVQ